MGLEDGLREKLLDKPDEDKIKILSKAIIGFAVLIFIFNIYDFAFETGSFWSIILDPLFYGLTGFAGLYSTQKMQRYCFLLLLCLLLLDIVIEFLGHAWHSISGSLGVVFILVIFVYYILAFFIVGYTLKVTYRYHTNN